MSVQEIYIQKINVHDECSGNIHYFSKLKYVMTAL